MCIYFASAESLQLFLAGGGMSLFCGSFSCEHDSRARGFVVVWGQLVVAAPTYTGSAVVVRLGCFCGKWDFPGPGIEPMSLGNRRILHY